MSEPAPEQTRTRARPRVRTLDQTEGERHASWLELFFDLVFVLAVAQVARVLTEHTDGAGFAKYAVLFVPVWWSWVGFTFYADRFESDEAAYRVLMFAGMLAVIGFSLTLDGAFTPAGDVALVVCYVLVRLVLVLLYVRAAYHIPMVRAFSLQYPIGIGISSLMLLLSLFFEPPVRYAVWAAAMALELVTPYLNLKAARVLPIDRSHIPERFGLFTIIVLGEAVIATASGAADVAWTPSTIATAGFGFAMAAAIWWINFDLVEDSGLVSGSMFRRFVYVYGHYFIVASIVAAGVGVEHAIKETGEGRLHLSTLALLCGGVAAYLSVITVIRIVTGVCDLIFPRIAAIALVLALLYAGQFLPPTVVVAATLFLLSAALWVENLYYEGTEEDISPSIAPCVHAGEVRIFEPRSTEGCEECIRNNYKWVHLRLCMSCGHVGCCDSSVYKHATGHFRETGHPIIASLETDESWAWCYVDERFVPAAPAGDG